MLYCTKTKCSTNRKTSWNTVNISYLACTIFVENHFSTTSQRTSELQYFCMFLFLYISIVLDLGEASFHRKCNIEYTEKCNMFTIYAIFLLRFTDPLWIIAVQSGLQTWRYTFVNVLGIAKHPSWNFFKTISHTKQIHS